MLTPPITSTLIIKDSFLFVQELFNSIINSSRVVMASFDVKSLFTNIPADKTIDIILNTLFSNMSLIQQFFTFKTT